MVRGCPVDISHATISRFLYGPTTGHSWPLNTAEFDYRWDIVRGNAFQRNAEQREAITIWLAKNIVADGKHAEWVTAPQLGIRKATLNFVSKFFGLLRDRNPNWKDGEKDRYIPSHERQKPKDSKGGRSEDMLSRIVNKVEGSDKNFKEMKEDLSTLSRPSPPIQCRSSSWRPKWVIYHLISTRHSNGVCLVILWLTPRMRLMCGKFSEGGKLARKRSSGRIAKEDPDLDRRWTQDKFNLDSVKLGEPRKLLASRRPSRLL
uniref:Integrase core domain containing protein n=1 Tax=Solanum tuberosum TaxID=4113 RepID=M1DF67_SOLTU